MRNKRTKRNLVKALNLSLITGLSFGTIAMAIAVPMSLNTTGVKQFQHINLNKKFPKLKNFLAMSSKIAQEELSDVVVIDKIHGFENFKRRKRTAGPVEEKRFDLANDTTVYIFQRPHLDNRVIYIETSIDPITNLEAIDLAFEFSGIEVVDLVETLKLGNEILGNGAQGYHIKGSFRELLNNMREISIRSMRFIANQLGLPLDDNNDPFPSDFNEDVFEKQLAKKINDEQELMDKEFSDLLPSRSTRAATHSIFSNYQGQDGQRFIVSEEDIFEHVLLHNMEMQKEFSTHLTHTIQQIKDEAFKSIILENNNQKMKAVFNNPIYWMEGISQIIVNSYGEFNTNIHLEQIFNFAKKYVPNVSLNETNKAFCYAINSTIDSLIERYEDYGILVGKNPEFLQNNPNYKIPKIIPGQTLLQTRTRLETVLKIVDRGRQSTDPAIAAVFDSWQPIDFEVLMDKSDSYSRSVIFRTTNLKKPKTIFAHEALNKFTGIKGFINFKEHVLVNDAFSPIFDELIEAADGDSTGISPESRYLLGMMAHENDANTFNRDISEYKPIFSFLHNWFEEYHTTLTAEREKELLKDLDETLTDGLDEHENILDSSKRDNWIYDDMMLLVSQIFLHEIVRGHHFKQEWSDGNVNHSSLHDLQKHFEAERMMPGTPEYKAWVDPYEMIEEVALSMNEIGIKVDKNMINKYIMRKRRRRRR